MLLENKKRRLVEMCPGAGGGGPCEINVSRRFSQVHTRARRRADLRKGDQSWVPPPSTVRLQPPSSIQLLKRHALWSISDCDYDGNGTGLPSRSARINFTHKVPRLAARERRAQHKPGSAGMKGLSQGGTRNTVRQQGEDSMAPSRRAPRPACLPYTVLTGLPTT